MGVASEESRHMSHAHAVLMTLRLLLRDEKFQYVLMTGTDPLPVLVRCLSQHIQLHFSSSSTSGPSRAQGKKAASTIHYSTDLLKELTSESSGGVTHFRIAEFVLLCAYLQISSKSCPMGVTIVRDWLM